jgi:hypothetical protein
VSNSRGGVATAHPTMTAETTTLALRRSAA